MMRILLPWPPRDLHPNARVHFHARGRIAKRAREDAWITALAATTAADREVCKAVGRLDVTVTFRPPDKRRRDDDGMIASLKSQRDGIADALGVDDARWTVRYVVGEPIRDGAVIVEVSPGEPAIAETWQQVGDVAKRLVERRAR